MAIGNWLQDPYRNSMGPLQAIGTHVRKKDKKDMTTDLHGPVHQPLEARVTAFSLLSVARLAS